jgi:hypothetical protein
MRDQMKDEFLKRIHLFIDDVEKDARIVGSRKKMEVLAFSILAMIDGEASDIGGFQLIPLVENGMDIAGSLHERFHEVKP